MQHSNQHFLNEYQTPAGAGRGYPGYANTHGYGVGSYTTPGEPEAPGTPPRRMRTGSRSKSFQDSPSNHDAPTIRVNQETPPVTRSYLDSPAGRGYPLEVTPAKYECLTDFLKMPVETPSNGQVR